MTWATALAMGCAATAGWLSMGRRRAAGRRLSAGPIPDTDRRGHRSWRPPSARGPWLVGAVVLGLGVAIGAGVAAMAVVGLGAMVAVRQRTVTRRRTARRREEEQAAAAMVALAAELRSGRAPTSALLAAAAEAGPEVASVLRRAAATAQLGGNVAAALTASADPAVAGCEGVEPRSAGSRPADCSGSSPVRWALAAAWAVGSRSGAGLAVPVERIADGLSASVALQDELAAELAGPRATAGLLAGLPVFGVGLATVGGAAPLHFLLHTPLGAGCLLGGVLLDIAGLLWTQAIVHRALRRAA